MSHELRKKEPVEAGLKRFIRKNVQKVAGVLSPKGAASPTGVHRARREIKQLRSALRLVKRELKPPVFKTANLTLRDIGRSLSPLRDAKVLLESFDAVTQGGRRDEGAKRLRSLLIDHNVEIIKRKSLSSADRQKLNRELARVRRSLKKQALKHQGWKALRPNLEDVYARGRASFKLAFKGLREEDFHEWRKWAKHLYYELKMLGPLQSSGIENLTALAHDLATCLGKNHDLSVLRAVLFNDPRFKVTAQSIPALSARIEKRRSDLQVQAQCLGCDLYADAPKAFVKKIEVPWKRWRAGVTARRSPRA